LKYLSWPDGVVGYHVRLTLLVHERSPVRAWLRSFLQTANLLARVPRGCSRPDLVPMNWCAATQSLRQAPDTGGASTDLILLPRSTLQLREPTARNTAATIISRRHARPDDCSLPRLLSRSRMDVLRSGFATVTGIRTLGRAATDLLRQSRFSAAGVASQR